MKVFKYLNYKDYLRSRIDEAKSERGYRTRLAKAAGIQLSFLSQVLHSHVELTPDHAIGMAGFWRLSENERDYFLELVQHARAATPALRGLIEERLERMRAQSEDLAQRFNKPRALDGAREALYYSSWHWSAIHILLTIPAYRTAKSIAQRLGLAQTFVEQTLESLQEMGLAILVGREWGPTQQDIHLAKDSLLTSVHHSNWRQRAIASSQSRVAGSIHYTAIHSLSRADAERIHGMILELIDATRSVVRPSKEEELVCFACDYFRP